MDYSGFRFAAMGSGSKGNATLVQHNDTVLLVDCGFSLKDTEARLLRFGFIANQITAIIVTHEHADHIGGVGPLSRKYHIPVFMTPGTWHAGRTGELPDLTLISDARPFIINDIRINPIAVPHDANEPVQYTFRAADRTLGILTDLGSITEAVVAHYSSCDALVLEMNHCVDMLNNGPYPESLKQRVGGGWGHLSNEQALYLLSRIKNTLKHLVLAHLSEQNNSPDQVRYAISSLNGKFTNVLIACQQRGFDWLDLST